MREYTMVFKEGISKGLCHSDNTPTNSQAFIEAKGVLHKTGTLNSLYDITTLDLSILGCVYPFPQVFQLRDFTLVCTPANIYTFTSSLQLVYIAEAGSTWTVADFFKFLVLSNGKETVIVDPITGEWTQYLDTAIPQSLCVCELNGQMLVGGPGVSISAGFLG